MIYVAIFAALIALSMITMKNPVLRTNLYWLVFLGLFLFSAFRFEVGCDWSGYLNQYYVYGAVPLSEVWKEREPLWVAIFSIQTSLEIPYPWINVISSAIFFMGAHAMARRQPDPLAFLIFLFPILILNMPMSGIRQGAAIGVMFYAFNAFIDRALVRFVLLVILASILHQSALVFLLLAPLVQGEYSVRRLLWAGGLALPGAALLMSGEAAELASVRYLDSGRDATGALFRVGLVALTGLYFLIFIKNAWFVRFRNDFKLPMVTSILMIGAFFILPISSIIADRIAYYLVPIQALIITRIPYLFSDRGRLPAMTSRVQSTSDERRP